MTVTSPVACNFNFAVETIPVKDNDLVVISREKCVDVKTFCRILTF